MKERLKQFRKALGLKQREIAERLGVNVGVVGGWECGRDPIPSTRVYQLCNEYKLRREWLERGDGEMFEPVEKLTHEQERAAQRRFVLDVFDRLTADQQAIVLDALNKYVSNRTTNGGDRVQHVEISGDVGGSVNVEQK